MSDIIQLLPDNVANQIAAGEVVQRPASVVKELMENAVDAAAGHIKVIIKDAGKTLIQVIDDGEGMSTTDARLAFERHATSKIKTADDLFCINTNGFRGEALASIAAITHTTIKTKQENQELGTQIKIYGGEVISQEVIATAKGTNIEIKNLFYNIPARRNFLKSNAIETRHIIDTFQRVSLSYPNINFSLFHNDSEVYKLNDGNLRKRVVSVFGANTNEKLVPIKEDTDILKINGFITKPKYSKKKRGEQFFFVNNRFIKSAYLNHAVVNAYEGLLNHGYHPSYFLYLTVPPNSIDINIHPTKTEIKFDNERDLYAIIRSTIKHSLGQYNVAPILDFERNATFDTPYSFKNKTSKAPTINVDPDFNPFKSNQNEGYHKKENPNWQSLYVDNEIDISSIQNIKVEAEIIDNKLFDDASGNEYNTYQIHQKFIASSIKSGIVLIDQNLAHQRILYEEYLAKLTMYGIAGQQLLFPLNILLNTSDIEIIRGLKSDLNSAGINISDIKQDSIIIDALPITIPESHITSFIEELIENFKNEIPETSLSQIDTLAKCLARNLAIKPGTKLTNKEQENILNELFCCKEPNYSPFGKTTFITITMEELEDKFNL
jgi:DNA mismatch repair protein MutL